MDTYSRKLRLAMVGGGTGAFIGAVHRAAALMDGQAEWVAGAFSSNPETSRQTGQSLFLDPERVYATYKEMIEKEAARPTHERIDAVAIVTPNHLHAEPAILALKHGFHVIVDKPMAFSTEEALQIKAAVEESGLHLCVTHTYSGYPMIKEMRHRVATGSLGRIRKIYVEYPQGWLTLPLERDGQRQASWRTDPARSGAGGSVGDIGTHAAHLAEYVSGQHIRALKATLRTHIEGRRLDDDAAALLQFTGGASGVLLATQVAAGEENALKLRIYGDRGGLEWTHADPNTLLWKPLDQPVQVLRTGNAYLCEAARNAARVPPGHPEGYLEAFANLYMEFFRAIREHSSSREARPADSAVSGDASESSRRSTFAHNAPVAPYDFPGVEDGVRGMRFIEAMIASSAAGEAHWHPIPTQTDF